jgi:hypothetical protein
MANPNIVAVATIKGITKTQAATATIADLTAYPATSVVFKVNTLIASNIHASVAKDVSVALYTNHGSAPTTHYIAKSVTIPAKASLIIVDKSSSFYLIDNSGGLGQKLRVLATDTDVNFTVSYEEIS